MSKVIYLTCIKCGEKSSIENFPLAKQNKNGHAGKCKKCMAEYKKQHRENNMDKIKTYLKENKEKRLTQKRQHYKENKEYNCEYSKQYRKNNEEKCAEYNIRYYYNNTEILLEKAKKYRKDNAKYIREYNKQYYKANSEKVIVLQQRRESRKKGLVSTLTSEQWEYTKYHFDNKCCYCGKEKPLQQEHFIALSSNGEYSNNNIIPACKNCNCSKNNKDFFKWYINQSFYSKKRERKILNYLNYHSGIQQLKISIDG